MHSRDEIFNEISKAMQELFELDAAQITLEASLYEDLDLDSIDAVDLVVKLQDMTGEKIQPDQFKSVRTVKDIVDSVEQLLQD
ncbi:acyl carrier protein [Dongshaea marina]|uniref:acyl carrier protein n=1 Tax=Dongshaea marina TaxID=2047966 RepID=UPI000D3EAB6E|nr:acyl carrier protein [Dongshaea marina]